MISNYPQGAEYDSNASYNEEIIESIPIEVTVSITMSKTATIYVDNYTKEYNKETGEINYDLSKCNLKEEFVNQTPLPNEWYKYLDTSVLKEEMEDWVIDDLEVIEE